MLGEETLAVSEGCDESRLDLVSRLVGREDSESGSRDVDEVLLGTKGEMSSSALLRGKGKGEVENRRTMSRSTTQISGAILLMYLHSVSAGRERI